MKKYVLVGALLVVTIFSFFGGNESRILDKNQSINPPREKWIQDFENSIADIIQKENIPGAALAIVKDSMTFTKGFGLRKVGTNDFIDEHTIFRIGSISKSFAGILTGILVEEKQLSWEDKVKDYLPGFNLSSPRQAANINLQHLLSHTTGLPYHTYTNLVESGVSIDKIIPKLADLKLVAEEGTVYSYQNAVFSIIAEVVDMKMDQSYQSLLKEKIFMPLQMTDASTDQATILNHPNKAIPHRAVKAGWATRKISKKYYNAVPAGGVNASISDMGQYLQLLIGNRSDIISSKTLSKIYHPFIKTPVKRRYFKRWPAVKKAWEGMGWRVLDNGGDTIIYHSGYVNGYRSEIAFNPKEKVGICILLNATSKSLNSSIPRFFEAYKKEILE